MKWITHILGAILITILLLKAFPISVGFILSVIAGSILPDLIEFMLNFQHRSIVFHNYLGAFILLLLGTGVGWILGLGLGYLHHLVLDSVTKKGVFFLNRRVYGSLNTNEAIDNLAVFGVHVIIVVPLVLL